MESAVRELIEGDDEPFETGAIPRMVDKHELAAFQHENFWQPMDTLREKNELEAFAKSGNPPWLKIQ